jgi:hypothetical protein
VITGSFQQKTGAYIRSAPGNLSGRKLPVSGTVSISNFSSLPIGCHSASCVNLPPDLASFYNGFRCTVSFPAGCNMTVPQQFTMNVNSGLYSSWYPLSTTIVNLPLNPPPPNYTQPVIFTYNGLAGWMKVIDSDIIRSSVPTLVNNIPFITDRYDSNTAGLTP